jgi:putative membrane protein
MTHREITQGWMQAAGRIATRGLWAAATLSLLALSLLPAASPAQDRGAAGAGRSVAQAGELKGSAHTLWKLHQVNQTEIKAGDLAKNNARSAAVKSYGELLVKDHTAADEKVKASAKKLNVDLDQPPPASDKAEVDETKSKLDALRSAKGADFDSQFIKAMVDGHKKAIALVTSARADPAQKDIRPLLGEVLPTLRHHLQLAQQLQQSGGRMANRPQGRTKSPP